MLQIGGRLPIGGTGGQARAGGAEGSRMRKEGTGVRLTPLSHFNSISDQNGIFRVY